MQQHVCPELVMNFEKHIRKQVRVLNYEIWQSYLILILVLVQIALVKDLLAQCLLSLSRTPHAAS